MIRDVCVSSDEAASISVEPIQHLAVNASSFGLQSDELALFLPPKLIIKYLRVPLIVQSFSTPLPSPGPG